MPLLNCTDLIPPIGLRIYILQRSTLNNRLCCTNIYCILDVDNGQIVYYLDTSSVTLQLWKHVLLQVYVHWQFTAVIGTKVCNQVCIQCMRNPENKAEKIA